MAERISALAASLLTPVPPMLPERPIPPASVSLYFSVVTFSTLGYGDISPCPPTRPFAAAHALIGNVHLGLFAAAAYAFVRSRSAKDADDHPDRAQDGEGQTEERPAIVRNDPRHLVLLSLITINNVHIARHRRERKENAGAGGATDSPRRRRQRP